MSAALESEDEFSWDELERLVLAPSSVPDTLVVWIRGWGALVGDRGGPGSRRTGSCGNCSDRCRTARGGAVLADLCAWSGQPPEGRRTHRTLSAEQTGALARTGVVEVGAHTVTHPRLASLHEHEQRSELAAADQALEEVLGAPVTQFSFPFGGAADYSPATVALTQKVGFDVTCTQPGFRGRASARTRFGFRGSTCADSDPATFEKSLTR